MKGLVIYSSKYGSTQQYADYISLALSIPIENAGNIHASGLASYDYLVIGSPVYIGKLLIKKWLKAGKDHRRQYSAGTSRSHGVVLSPRTDDQKQIKFPRWNLTEAGRTGQS